MEKKKPWQVRGDLEDLLNQEVLDVLQQDGELTERDIWQLTRHLREQTKLLVVQGLQVFDKLPSSFKLPPAAKPRSVPADDRAERRKRGARGLLAAIVELEDRGDLWYLEEAIRTLREHLPESD